MKTLQFILITLTALSACKKKDVSAQPTNNNTTVTKTDSMNYLALGDSYTIGQSVPLSESYPYQLVDSLNQHSVLFKAPTIIATTGWTTDDLISAISNSGINGKKFDFVTLLIGVNDQYQGLSQANYTLKFAQVLNTAINFADGDPTKVFVLSIPDYGVTPFANGQDAVIGPQIDQFNAINKAASLKAGVNYLDITAISRMAATDPSLIADDGLHPSVKMYAMWVKLLEPMVATQFKK